MSTFSYKAYDGRGKTVRGLLEANSLKDARKSVTQKGLLIADIRPVQGRRLAARVLAKICRQLSTLLLAGLSIPQALQVMMSEMPVSFLAVLRDCLAAGGSFCTAWREAAGGQNTDFAEALLLAGEKSGTLPAALAGLAQHVEEQVKLREKILTAMLYPCLVLLMAVVVMFCMFVVVLPQFGSLLLESKIQLPLATRWLFTLTRPLAFFCVFGLGGCVLGVVWGRQLLRSRPAWRLAWDERLFALPLWGRAYDHLVAYRFARTLSLLLRGGVPLVEALFISGRVTGNKWLEERIVSEAERVRVGYPLATAIGEIEPFAKVLTSWFQAGTAGGDLAELLAKAAEYEQGQWETTLTRLTNALEPAVILVVGGLVLLLALALLLPVMAMNNLAL